MCGFLLHPLHGPTWPACSASSCGCCSMAVSAGDAHQLVRNYLLFNGFGGSLAAFDAAAGVEGIAQPMW